MFKIVSVFACFNFFTFISFFQNNSIQINQVTPITLAEGEKHEVKVIIKKNDISGFAKFEVSVDSGIEVSAGDIGSASFTFEDGVAKFIWFALPEDPEFRISYFIENQESEIGMVKTVDSKFSYLDDNIKKVYQVPQYQFTIETYSNSPLVALDDIIVESHADEESGIILSEEEKLEAIRNYKVKINREFQRIESGLYRMNITIDKGPIEGFAKLEDVVPDGFDYIEEETSGAIFTKIKGKAKFVWFNVPEDPIVSVSYNLRAEESNVVGLHNITGDFIYLVDDQDILNASVPAFFEINSTELEEAMAANNIGKLNKEEQEAKGGLWQTETINEEEIMEEEEIAMNDKSSESSEDITSEMLPEIMEQTEGVGITGMNKPKPEDNLNSEIIIKENGEEEDMVADQNTEIGISQNLSTQADEGINYRVQICATRNAAPSNYFKTYKNFNFPVIIENHEGWVKYTTGSFDQYKTARNSREGINQNYDFDGPFIAAYNDGVRISVQEALMISNQKWFQ